MASPTDSLIDTRRFRNVAIIAHVDHGKTTLVDAMLQQSGVVKLLEHGQECVLDSNPLERERGITILAKNCAVTYTLRGGPRRGEVYRVNIIDTPGHADFGGEVERVLRMADGCLLLVDAAEGPMPQTRFVLSKALDLGLRPIVVINKCDRPDARIDEVVNEVFDLLVDLHAPDEALDFPIIYASGREGWASRDANDKLRGVDDLFQTIIDRVPAPKDDVEAPLQMLVTSLAWSEYVGRIAIGRVFAGRLRGGQPVGVCKLDGSVKKTRVMKVNRFEGLGRREAELIEAGDLCAVEGIADIDIGDTIADIEKPMPLPRVKVDEPTLHMIFRINDGPFGGAEGKYVTSRQIAERLERELQSNVALKVVQGDTTDEFHVSGRGLLHLGVLLENMRREGFELTVGKPEVIEREIDGVRCEPYERLSLDVVAEAMGPALELLGSRGTEILTMDPRGGRMHIEAEIPARGLIGLRTRILTATGGEAVMHHTFSAYKPVRTGTKKRQNGVMLSLENGRVTAYAIENLSDRGVMFVKPGEQVYSGQIIGEHNRDNDIVVNITRLKALTNFRETAKDVTVVLKPPRMYALEAALEYIESDELTEVTPQSVRMRKKILDESARKRSERSDRGREMAGA
ncbi:MAG: translational GTPase TypA [Phycisphaerae bacterium]|nr:translational GTPase TypA [Phycisphaerae bacterium]